MKLSSCSADQERQITELRIFNKSATNEVMQFQADKRRLEEERDNVKR